jgi:NAD(P)-dependent dehydrogenase (short-subunit alcohol dehydrogenase family)
MIPYHGVKDDYSLAGKTAIITGGAAGIGLATAEFFARKGVNLLIADLNPQADAAAKKLGARNIGLPGDICNGAYRRRVMDAAVEAFGGADILVNSAGIVALEKAQAISADFWDRTIGVNLTASFMMAQVFGAWLIDNGRGGSIVNMASQIGRASCRERV